MPHSSINPPELSPPVGFSHAILAARGRTVYFGGQTAQAPDGGISGETVVEQFDLALANLTVAMRAAGVEPKHVVNMTIYSVDAAEYRAHLSELGAVYRKHLGKHYPAMAFFVVAGLFDPAAKVELVCTAVVPDASETRS